MTTATETSTYCHTLALHGALPIFPGRARRRLRPRLLRECQQRVPGNEHHHERAARQAFDGRNPRRRLWRRRRAVGRHGVEIRSAEHTSELQSLMSISYAVFCLKKKKI